MTRFLVLAVLSLTLPLSAADSIEDWTFTWKLWSGDGTEVAILIDDTGSAVYRIGGRMMSMRLSGDDADGISKYLAEVLPQIEDGKLPTEAKVVGKHRVSAKQKDDGAVRVVIEPDREMAMDMVVLSVRDAKQVGKALTGGAERLTMIRERLKAALRVEK